MSKEINLSLRNLSNKKSKTHDASWMYAQLVQCINNFENSLPDDLQAGGRLVSAGNLTFSIQNIGYWNPNVIIFQGSLTDGTEVELLQHISQLNVLLVAVPRQDTKEVRRKIGFLNEDAVEIDE